MPRGRSVLPVSVRGFGRFVRATSRRYLSWDEPSVLPARTSRDCSARSPLSKPDRDTYRISRNCLPVKGDMPAMPITAEPPAPIAAPPKPHKPTQSLEAATVRFCGDSGDGMQLVGLQMTNTSALIGNDVATFPDFPAEIRAPRGTKAGVTGFQTHFRNQ